VGTSAARYQNLAINQTKLSGQCGRLKCCLNYELDSYLDALADFPEHADRLRTTDHKYELIKTDIFKGIMYYVQVMERGRGAVVAIPKERVTEILAMNKNREYPEELVGAEYASIGQEENDFEQDDLTGHIELPAITKNRRNKRRPDNRRSDNSNRRSRNDNRSGGNSRKTENSSDRPSNTSNDANKSSKNEDTKKNDSRRTNRSKRYSKNRRGNNNSPDQKKDNS
jgi:hypothetical protein